MNPNPIFCAIDTPDLAKAAQLAADLQGHVGGLKLGLEFYMAHGPVGFLAIATKTSLPLFLDVKLHDIPNTVAGAIGSLLSLKPAFITIHTSGGSAMMKAAADAAAKAGQGRPKLLGVTVLTSMDGQDLAAVGQDVHTKDQVLRLAKLSKNNGLDGVICSPEEVEVLRQNLGPDFILMVPGIRPTWAVAGDQKRVMTPKEAVTAGANYLVIGRPITDAEHPVDAAKRIVGELA